MSSPATTPNDHGLVARRHRFRLSWVWLFPILAGAAASFMFYNNWKSEGPEIQIEFASAPGMRPDKTPLIYRGVVAGQVTSVQLNQKLDKVVVHVRLKNFAKDLARQGTIFWINQPVFNLAKTSGIQSLIDGNSLQAQMGSGAPTSYFIGSDKVPLTPLDNPSLTIRLHAAVIPFVETGCEVSFRGITVGFVDQKGLDEKQEPYVDVDIDKQYAGLVRSNARFWNLPPLSVKVASGMFKLDIPSLKSLMLGGIAFDYFGDQGELASNGANFPLFADELMAKAISDPITLEFKNGQGLLAGSTQLRYLGIPVGVVEKVIPSDGKVVVTARLERGYDLLRRRGSIFSVIRPSLELPKVAGLETVVSGIYIDCIPGAKGPTTARFSGSTQEDAELIEYDAGEFEVILQSPSTKIMAGTSVIYRGVRVGKIIRKALTADGQRVNLTASIQKKYASLLRENTRFWNAGGVKISGGLISLNVQASALEPRVLAGVEFATPEGAAMGDPVKPGHVYELYPSPKKDWLNWLPNIPLPN